jgi:hypothetical protein
MRAPDPTTVPPANVFDADELCWRIGVGRNKLAQAFKELEFAGFIVNLTPGNEPLKSLSRLTMFPYCGEPPTHDISSQKSSSVLRKRRQSARPNTRTEGRAEMASNAMKIPRQSRAWAVLGLAPRFLITELSEKRRSAASDGPVACSENTAAEICAVARKTARRALKDLEDLGFLACIMRGTYKIKGKATLWRLTMFPYLGQPATHDYLFQSRIDRYLKNKPQRGGARVRGERSAIVLTEMVTPEDVIF